MEINQEFLTAQVKQVFEELVRRGKVRTYRAFYRPLGIADTTGSLIQSNQRKFPKTRVDILCEYWKVSKVFLISGALPMFKYEEIDHSNDVLHEDHAANQYTIENLKMFNQSLEKSIKDKETIIDLQWEQIELRDKTIVELTAQLEEVKNKNN